MPPESQRKPEALAENRRRYSASSPMPCSRFDCLALGIGPALSNASVIRSGVTGRMSARGVGPAALDRGHRHHQAGKSWPPRNFLPRTLKDRQSRQSTEAVYMPDRREREQNTLRCDCLLHLVRLIFLSGTPSPLKRNPAYKRDPKGDEPASDKGYDSKRVDVSELEGGHKLKRGTGACC